MMTNTHDTQLAMANNGVFRFAGLRINIKKTLTIAMLYGQYVYVHLWSRAGYTVLGNQLFYVCCSNLSDLDYVTHTLGNEDYDFEGNNNMFYMENRAYRVYDTKDIEVLGRFTKWVTINKVY